MQLFIHYNPKIVATLLHNIFLDIPCTILIDPTLTATPLSPSIPAYCRTATALILIFQLSFAADLSYVSCLEVSYHSKQGPQQKGNHEEEEEEDEKDICRLLP